MKISITITGICVLFLNSILAQTTWQKQNSPVEEHLHDVFFLNDSVGWAYSYGTGLIIHTSNSGVTWHVQARLDSLYFEQIQFIDYTHGWLCGDLGTIYKTSDGGNNWIDVSPALSNRITSSYDWGAKEKPEGWHVLFYAMHFFSAEHGIVAGGMYQPSENTGWQNMQPVFFTTNDGGESWIQNKQAPEDFLYNITFLDDSLGYASGNSRIFQTKDGGHTWSVVYNEYASKRKQIRGMSFLDASTGFAVNFNGEFLKTTDGALSWSKSKITKNRLRSVYFIDEKNGFAAGDSNREEGVLVQTQDGGTTWRKSDGDFRDLHRIKASHSKIWAVGKGGTIISRDKH